jgi:predicted RNA-binding protein with PIN domain
MLEFGMALLIDGYNLLHVTGIFAEAGPGTELHRTRLALLKFLATSIERRERRDAAIVFDAAGAPPGLPRQIMHEGITVHFAHRHSDADEMIEHLLEECAAPRSLLVVSSDHRVQRAARHCGASYVDSEAWYRDVLAANRQRNASAEEAALKPSGKPSPEELNYWLRQFGEGPKNDERSDNPFPPGYGDDLEDEPRN